MKKIVFIAVFLLSHYCWGQTIPNAGFETWSTTGLFLSPTGWAVSPGVFQSNQAHSGSWALQCTVDTFTNPATSALDTLAGMAYSGAATSGPPAPGADLNGFAISTMPDSLTGYYKFRGLTTDTCRIAVTISKWFAPSNSRIVIGQAVFTTSVTDTTYQRFSIPLQYVSDSMPDTCVIQVLATNPQGPKHMGTSIWVDDLAFANHSAGITNPESSSLYTVYPVPFSNVLNVSETNNLQVKYITLFDLAGRVLVKTTGHSINTATIPSGSYMLCIVTCDGQVTQQKVSKE